MNLQPCDDRRFEPSLSTAAPSHIVRIDSDFFPWGTAARLSCRFNGVRRAAGSHAWASTGALKPSRSLPSGYEGKIKLVVEM
jgi:hypothetical protein